MLWEVIPLALSMAALAGTAWAVRASAPAALAQRAKHAAERAEWAAEKVEALEVAHRTLRTEWAAFQESMEDVAESVERKRKRVAAQTSRQNHAEPPKTRAEYLQQLRAQAGLRL